MCCRCHSDVQDNVSPGRRACHITCGPCLYPDNPKCTSCEIVGHCRLALDYLRSLDPSYIEKGYYFSDQLTGDETLFHTLAFVDGHQGLVHDLGEKRYLEELKSVTSSSPRVAPKLVLDLPRDPNVEWTRITLTKPISSEAMESISKEYGVMMKPEDNLHIVVRGKQGPVKKAIVALLKQNQN